MLQTLIALCQSVHLYAVSVAVVASANESSKIKFLIQNLKFHSSLNPGIQAHRSYPNLQRKLVLLIIKPVPALSSQNLRDLTFPSGSLITRMFPDLVMILRKERDKVILKKHNKRKRCGTYDRNGHHGW